MTEFDYQKPPEEDPQSPPVDAGEEQVDVRLLRQQLEMMRMESQQEIIILRQELESLRSQISAANSVAPPRADDVTHDFASNADAGSRVDVGRPMDLSHQTYRPQENWNQDMSTLLARIEKLETQPDRKRIFFREVFFAQASANSSGGVVPFKEMFVNASGIVTFPGGRSAGGTASLIMHSGAGAGAANNTILLVQAYQNANTTEYAALSLPTWFKPTTVASGNVTTGCVYNGTWPDGSSHTAKNTMEPVTGSPGPLGLTLSNATVGSCTIKPIGPQNGFLPAFADANGTLWFTAPNSAQ